MYITSVCELKPTTEIAISAVALPKWLEVILKSKGLKIEEALDSANGNLVDILSDRDVIFHNDVSYLLDNFLFEQNTYEDKQRIFKRLKDAWFAIPMSNDYSLELVPRLATPNLIVIEAKTGEEANEALNTDIYERLMQCYHQAAVAQHGTSVWASPLVKAILGKIQPTE